MDSTNTSIPTNVSRQELRAKLRRKINRNKKTPPQQGGLNSVLPQMETAVDGLDPSNPQSILNMMNQVNSVLQQNPQMLETISKCMSTMFENKDLMDNIKQNIQKEMD